MSAAARARVQVVGAAALFSTGGAAIKDVAFDGFAVASLRSLVAAVAVLLFVPGVRRVRDWRIPLVGVAYAATLVLFVLANKLTTSANAIFLQSTAPLYLLLVGPWLLREPARRGELALMGVVAVGMALLFAAGEAPQRTAPDPLLGNVLATASGVTWAATLAGLRWLSRRGDTPEAGMATVAAGNLLAGLACLPWALPFGGAVPVGAVDWLVIAYLGVIQIGLAYVLLTRGIARVNALEAALLLLLEPALNPVWSWLVHGERPAPLALAAGALIVGATLARSALSARRPRPANGQALPS